MTGPTVEQAISRAHHEEWARVVADLTRRFGDLDVAEGNALVRERIEAVAAGGCQPGRYLYGHMVLLDPSPIVRLNRAVAEVDGSEAGLAEIDQLAG